MVYNYDILLSLKAKQILKGNFIPQFLFASVDEKIPRAKMCSRVDDSSPIKCGKYSEVKVDCKTAVFLHWTNASFQAKGL